MDYNTPKRPKHRPPLTRTASGRLRPDNGDHEIGDVWAQQRRIQLADSLEEERKQAALARWRREHGLVGLAKLRYRQAIRMVRRELFGTTSLQKQTASNKQSLLHKLLSTTKAASLSTVAVSKKFMANRKRRALSIMALVAIAAGLPLTYLAIQPDSQSSDTAGNNGQKEAANTDRVAPPPGALERGTPNYATIIPQDKTIEQLGGWTRISPPDREAVYAYTDTLAGVQIAVSQQPLPDDFKDDPDASAAELAKSYKADQSVKQADTTVHIGTSARGPQSVIFTKKGLLVLIKSEAPIAASEWLAYIGSLR